MAVSDVVCDAVDVVSAVTEVAAVSDEPVEGAARRAHIPALRSLRTAVGGYWGTIQQNKAPSDLPDQPVVAAAAVVADGEDGRTRRSGVWPWRRAAGCR